MKNFIAIYQDALTASFCERCIEKFERSPYKTAGKTGHGVDPAKKISTDITINNCLDDWQDELPGLQQVVLNRLLQYVREYPFLLAGAIALQHQGPDGDLKNINHLDIRSMDAATLGALVMKVYRLGSINLQKYDQGRGGYFHWHSEHYPHPTDPGNDALHRVLLWMFFLNDVDEGGETEFYFQDLSIRPRRGAMVIAPATFTHTHRGAMPVSGDKYILTSWVLYQRAQALYESAE